MNPDVPTHRNPVWIGVCSCGVPTGLVAICGYEPSPDNVRQGHEGHTTSVRRFDADELRQPGEPRELLNRALQTGA